MAAEALADEAFALARRLAEGPTLAFGEAKNLMLSSPMESLEAQLESEARAMARVTRTEDAVGAMRAVLANASRRSRDGEDEPMLLDEDQLAIRDLARRFAREKLAPRYQARDKTGVMDKALIREMGELGLMGVDLPERTVGSARRA